MSGSVRILVYHKNQLIRDCLAKVLSQNESYDAQAGETLQSPIELPRDPIDVILVDLNLPESLAVELTKVAVRRREKTKVVLLVGDDHSNLLECIAAGAHGCVLEQLSLDELGPAIARVMRGETFCSTDMVDSIFVSLSRVTQTNNWRSEVPEVSLTTREIEVLELLSKRFSNKQIAKKLAVSIYTVKNHVHNILDKMHVQNRQDAVAHARSYWLHARS